MKAISLGYHDIVDTVNDARAGSGALYELDHRDFHHHIVGIRRQTTPTAVRSIDSFHRWEKQIPVFLTFDDGGLGAYNYAAGELEANNWRGHFFVVTNWVGRTSFLDRSRIRELRRRGHVIGSHSCSHPERMSHLSGDEVMKEWSQSCAILSDILGEKVKVASVPNGYFSKNVGRAAAAAGIEVLFTSEATTGISVLDDCLIIGRYFIQRHMDADVSGAIA